MLLTNAKLLTVWDLACGDTEAVLCLGEGNELVLNDNDPVAGAVLEALIQAGTLNVDRGDSSPRILRVRVFHYE